MNFNLQSTDTLSDNSHEFFTSEFEELTELFIKKFVKSKCSTLTINAMCLALCQALFATSSDLSHYENNVKRIIEVIHANMEQIKKRVNEEKEKMK